MPSPILVLRLKLCRQMPWRVFISFWEKKLSLTLERTSMAKRFTKKHESLGKTLKNIVMNTQPGLTL